MATPQLSVVIACKNEERNIRLCIESVRDVADEIVVADSGSTDRTMEIVRRMGGCRLVEREFVNFADFKNWAISQANCPWVLIVDADERLTPELTDEIRQALLETPDEIDAYRIGRQNHFLGHETRRGAWGHDSVIRLVRRDRCRLKQRRVHESFSVDPRRVRTLRRRMLHYPYWTYDQYFAKLQTYTRLGCEDYWEAGRRARLLDLLLRPAAKFFQSYVLRLGFLDGAIGVHVCALEAIGAFLKYARLWEREHALDQPHPDRLRGEFEDAPSRAA